MRSSMTLGGGPAGAVWASLWRPSGSRSPGPQPSTPFNGPDGSTGSPLPSQPHQVAAQGHDCLGLVGVAGEADGSARTIVSSPSCGTVSAEALKSNIGSKADWYAAFSPKLSVGALKMGCGLSYADARTYAQKLGPTFSVETLRSFQAVCKG